MDQRPPPENSWNSCSVFSANCKSGPSVHGLMDHFQGNRFSLDARKESEPKSLLTCHCLSICLFRFLWKSSFKHHLCLIHTVPSDVLLIDYLPLYYMSLHLIELKTWMHTNSCLSILNLKHSHDTKLNPILACKEIW